MSELVRHVEEIEGILINIDRRSLLSTGRRISRSLPDFDLGQWEAAAVLLRRF